MTGTDECVRWDGGEEGKRVSRTFFCPRKLLSLSRKQECLRRNFFPLREGVPMILSLWQESAECFLPAYLPVS